MPSSPPSLWHHQEFVKLWTGQTISALGSRITRDGLPIAAVLALGATPAEMGVLAAAGAAPILLVGLFAGVWVDRMHRRPILILADLGRALLLMTIPAAALAGVLSMAQLYIVAALAGILTVFFDVAYAAYLPTLVQREHILEGNSKLALSESTAEILGPGLAGLLVQALTAPLAILIDALSFIASSLSVALIRQVEPAPADAPAPVGRAIAQGLRVGWGDPILRALAGSAGTIAFFGNFIGTLYALYSLRELGMGAAALGITISFGGVGSLIGALLGERIVQRWGLGKTLMNALLVVGGATLLIPLAYGPPFLVLLMMIIAQLVGDAGRTIYFVNEVSLRQSITPNPLLGRTNAGIAILVAAMSLVGALFGGLLGQTIGLRPTLALAAVGEMAALAWLFYSPVRRLRTVPASIDVSAL